MVSCRCWCHVKEEIRSVLFSEETFCSPMQGGFTALLTGCVQQSTGIYGLFCSPQKFDPEKIVFFAVHARQGGKRLGRADFSCSF